MSKRRVRKKHKRSIFNWKFLLPSLSIFAFIIALSTSLNNRHTFSDLSLGGEEILEIQQDIIPNDVKEHLKNQEKVLGVKIFNQNNQVALPTSIHVPILMYHYVEYVQDQGDKTRISLNTTPYTLEQEIKTLSEAGYAFLTTSELVDVFDGKKTLPQKPILLTFDDGYRDFYTDVYPILKKYNVKATQYVIAGFMDRQNHLLTSQLKEIANDGLVEIGAHTVNHLWLKGLASKVVNDEVFQSKEILEKIINKPVTSFAYPFGAFDLQAIKVVEAAGFTTSTSTIPGIDQTPTNKFFLYRLRPGGRMGEALLNWLNQVKNKE